MSALDDAINIAAAADAEYENHMPVVFAIPHLLPDGSKEWETWRCPVLGYEINGELVIPFNCRPHAISSLRRWLSNIEHDPGELHQVSEGDE